MFTLGEANRSNLVHNRTRDRLSNRVAIIIAVARRKRSCTINIVNVPPKCTGAKIVIVTPSMCDFTISKSFYTQVDKAYPSCILYHVIALY